MKVLSGCNRLKDRILAGNGLRGEDCPLEVTAAIDHIK